MLLSNTHPPRSCNRVLSKFLKVEERDTNCAWVVLEGFLEEVTFELRSAGERKKKRHVMGQSE